MVPRARVKAVRSGHFAVPLKMLGVERGGALQCEAGSLLDVQMPGPLLEIWTHWVWAGAGPWSSQTNLLQQVTWGSSLRGFVSCNRHLSPKELLGRWMANSLNALRIPIRVPVGVQGLGREQQAGGGREADASLVKGGVCRHPFKVPCALGSFPSQILSLGACPWMELPQGIPGPPGEGGGGRSKGRRPDKGT